MEMPVWFYYNVELLQPMLNVVERWFVVTSQKSRSLSCEPQGWRSVNRIMTHRLMPACVDAAHTITAVPASHKVAKFSVEQRRRRRRRIWLFTLRPSSSLIWFGENIQGRGSRMEGMWTCGRDGVIMENIPPSHRLHTTWQCSSVTVFHNGAD